MQVNILAIIYLELEKSVDRPAIDLKGALNIGRLKSIFPVRLQNRAIRAMVQKLGYQIAQKNLNYSLTYEQLMNRHRNWLIELNISLCRECLIPIERGKEEHCNECIPL
ncbi:hypothetical protein C1645_815491 [Glomus cerebriforme]|uniref:Uncharacterized protein n=1 Tax=Glomus cerebriforme TaxID=658196 RepID=A0A397TIK8_9GLOM|nr:hypothetical protein C1645_815491 [Glomus cerebriforme]